MISHIALLRAVNVGENVLKMQRLREILAVLGLADVKTYLQSGNALFRASGPPDGLSAKIEEGLRSETRLPVSVLIRTPAQLKRLIGANPFLREPDIDTKKLHVTFLAGPASKSGLAGLGAVKSGPDRWHAAGTEIYLHCPDGYARTKLNNTAIEKLLATRATTRNWNTVTALYEMSRQ
jgi:uncharacterized protein (DUF1697 family)